MTALLATLPYPASAARTETKLQYFILDCVSTTTADNTNELAALKKNSAHSTVLQVILAAPSTWSNIYTHTLGSDMQNVALDFYKIIDTLV